MLGQMFVCLNVDNKTHFYLLNHTKWSNVFRQNIVHESFGSFYDTFIVLLNIEIFCHDLSLLHEKMSTKYVFYKKL